MNPYIDEHKPQFEKTMEHLREELSKLRAGIATPAMIDHIKIDAYGTATPIQQVASITVPDAKTLLIQPWDKSITKNIEKGIIDAGQNLNPVNEGAQIRIVIPPLMEETRKKFLKIIRDHGEQARIGIRAVRDKVKEEITNAQRDSEITEDDKYLYVKQLDDTTSKYNQDIKEMIEKKETSIMTV